MLRHGYEELYPSIAKEALRLARRNSSPKELAAVRQLLVEAADAQFERDFERGFDAEATEEQYFWPEIYELAGAKDRLREVGDRLFDVIAQVEGGYVYERDANTSAGNKMRIFLAAKVYRLAGAKKEAYTVMLFALAAGWNGVALESVIEAQISREGVRSFARRAQRPRAERFEATTCPLPLKHRETQRFTE